MERVMMQAAEWNGVFVAELAAEGFGLSKPNVVRVRRGLLADEATLTSNKKQMVLASFARRLLWEGEANLLRARFALFGTSCGSVQHGQSLINRLMLFARGKVLVRTVIRGNNQSFKPGLVCGFHVTRVCLPKAVFERQAHLGPCQQVRTATNGLKLIEQPLPELGCFLGVENRSAVQHGFGGFGFRSSHRSRLSGGGRSGNGIGSIQIVLSRDADKGKQRIPASIGQRRPPIFLPREGRPDGGDKRFSGLVSSACALAKAAAMSPMRSLD
jgi:hypothetical protein